MSEIKHTFQAGKMNKDFDERLVPQGEYRDALNIEVRTSDGNDVGTAQTLSGNIERLIRLNDGSDITDAYRIQATTNWLGQESEIVGSLANEKTNKAYFFVASPPVNFFGDVSLITEEKLFKDMIVEYDTTTRLISPVVTDIFEVHITQSELGDPDLVSANFSHIDVVGTKIGLIRPGMQVSAFSSTGIQMLTAGNAPDTPVVRAVDNSAGKVYFDRILLDVGGTNPVSWVFTAPPVLGFHRDKAQTSKLITGINIIDDLLFWTDNNSEPKKINIKRSKAGSDGPNLEGFSNHTKLYITKPGTTNGTLVSISTVDEGTHDGLKEEHITVIRRAPRVAPKLDMSTSSRGNESVEGWTTNIFYNYTDSEPNVVGDIITNNTFQSSYNGIGINGATFYEGDTLVCTHIPEDGTPIKIRVGVVSVDLNTDFSNGLTYSLEILNIDGNIPEVNVLWETILEQDKPLFELKFGRFSYRYRYQDGEYSSFAPWSELAFIPGVFDYAPIKGYNLGMVNAVRSLKITDFIVEDSLRPDDVVDVDILYKDTVSPNVYIVKSIKRGVDPEWNESTNSGSTGVLDITSEMIHRTLPSSQSLRAWDNVPRLAKAQEVTGNRVLYANYLQNYDIPQPITLIQRLEVQDWASGVSDTLAADNLYGRKSIKSIRKYKIGVVFGDKYGRETPVIGMGGLSGVDSQSNTTLISADVHNPKVNAAKMTKLSAKQNWDIGTSAYQPSEWMEYFKYYVKETTNEYYNLSMDRWYDAEDGNIWISFQSSDRNKLDIETYLILKNEHGNDDPVEEEARYKILAIENEAPDYVKTTEKILGSVAIVEEDGNSLNGLNTTTIVNFSTPNWLGAFEGITFKGIGYARIRGIKSSVIKYSKWVKVSRMNGAEGSESVTTIQPFGEAADMYTAFGVESGDASVVFELELKQDIVENRPEFDGRFFVKIYKDSTLAENVLQQTNADMVYNTVDSFHYRFVQDRASNPANNEAATTGDHTDYPWDGSGNFAANDSSSDSNPGIGGDSTFGSGCSWNDLKYTKEFWTDYKLRDDSYWFLDHATKGENQSGGGKSKGLGSRASNILHKNSLDFSTIRNYFPPSTSEFFPFMSKMMTVGTLFRFKGDPSNDNTGIVYEVKSSTTSGGWGKNYKDQQGCDPCQESQSTSICHRKGFRLTFSRADDPYVGLDTSVWDPRGELKHDGRSRAMIDIVKPYYALSETEEYTEGNAIWETEPKEDVGLDLYYEATSALPMRMTEETNESFAPINSTVTCVRPSVGNVDIYGAYVATVVRDVVGIKSSADALVTNILVGDTLKFTHVDGTVTESVVVSLWGVMDDEADDYVSSVSAIGYYKLDNELYKYKTVLPWFNCYSFGNALESDRIRDDFNAPTIDNGCKVSTTLDTYGEERRSNGLIYSGIYNSTSGVNKLNEFNMAEAITKDLNPSYGSIQALKTRDTNVVAFCEDKVLQILANKDALFNADGNVNITASNAVLGDASGFAGDFGISSNPESLAVDGYRMYFTDKQRNKVIRLSQNGLTPISDVGMTSYFRDNLKPTHELIGSFDEIKGEYNLSLKHTPSTPRGDKTSGGITWTSSVYIDKTISFNEKSKGWVSFKSFIPQVGLSINDEYLTATAGKIWSHHDDTVAANNFYGVQYDSSIDILFNDNPGSVKSFAAINYEGTQANITQFTTQTIVDAAGNTLNDVNDNNYYNLNAKTGWYVNSFATDLQDGKVNEFIEKEGKWFNKILGVTTTLSNLDTSEFSVQGIGLVNSSASDYTPSFTLTIQEDGD